MAQIYRWILCLVLMGIGFTVWGQQIIVNSNGDKIIMYPDGSWRPIEPRDSLLLKQYLQRSAPPSTSTSFERHEDLPKGIQHDELRRHFIRLRNDIFKKEKEVQDEFRAATNAQFAAASHLKNAEANKKVITPDRMSALENSYKQSIQNLRIAKLNQKAIRKLASNAEDMSKSLSSLHAGKVSKLRAKYNIYLERFDAPVPVRETVITEMPDVQPSSTTAVSVAPVKEISPPHKKLFSYTTAPVVCRTSLDSTDGTTGRRYLALVPELIFTHTDINLRPYFKDKELVTCRGYLTKVGPYVYLTVNFQIAGSHSQKNFGALVEGSLLRIKLLNGELVSLYNLQTDRGKIDAYTGNTLFSGQYVLGKDEIRKLKTSELDKIRVMWSSGFEDYDVYVVDFLWNQLQCIENL